MIVVAEKANLRTKNAEHVKKAADVGINDTTKDIMIFRISKTIVAEEGTIVEKSKTIAS